MADSTTHNIPAEPAPEAERQPGHPLSRWESGTVPSIPSVDDQDSRVSTTARDFQQDIE
jgi:hypothetical protein